MQQISFYETASLYIHWPFCPYKCHFCPFVAIASHDQFMERYHNALKKEIDSFLQQSSVNMPIKTIYFGGGTPSTYPDHLLLDTFGTLNNRCLINQGTEISIEVNPGTVRSEQLLLWKEIGINRLSIGVQSLNDGVLAGLNRKQKASDVYAALEQASPLFENISIDLILGLPEITDAEWKAMLAQIVQWPINHISIYFLTVHENTPLFFSVKKQLIKLPDDDALVDLYHWTVDYLALHGIVRYELSNFSRLGYESRHNSVYWDHLPYKGFGLGACSFDGNRKRIQNEKNLMQYIEGVEHDSTIVCFEEELTDEQRYIEQLMLNLRRSCGISWQKLLQDMPELIQNNIRTTISVLKEQQLIEEQSDMLRLTPAGLVLENDVVLRLLDSAYKKI